MLNALQEGLRRPAGGPVKDYNSNRHKDIKYSVTIRDLRRRFGGVLKAV